MPFLSLEQDQLLKSEGETEISKIQKYSKSLLDNKSKVVDGRMVSEFVLIDLEKDPYELFNVYDDNKDIATDMINTIRARGM